MSELNYADVKPGDLITIHYPSGTTITGVMDCFGRNDSIVDIPFMIAADGSLHEGLALIAHTRAAPPAWDREGVEYVVDDDGNAWSRFGEDWICPPFEVVANSREIECEYGPCRALIPEDVA